MSKRESNGSIKNNAAPNGDTGECNKYATGDSVVGDTQIGDRPESQESLLKIFTGHGLKIPSFL